jgi:arylsulfatase A-like enzyme
LDAVVLDMRNLGTNLGREKRVRKIAGTWLVRQSCGRDLSPRARVRGIALPAVAAVMAVILVVGLILVVWIARPPRVTSIVLVVLDTVRADHCSAYGYGKPTTPRLERLATQGLLFEHARAAAPWTLPSHASLFTGKLPHQHGCHFEHRWLADSNDTIAEVLANHGFATFGVTTNPNASSLYHLDQGFTTFRETWRLRDTRRGLSDSAIANAEIRDFLEHRDREKPFFLFVNYADAHLPYAPPPPNDRLFGEASEHARKLAARGDLLQATLAGEETVGPEDQPGLAALYDGDVRTADERLGELLDLLDQQKLADDTVVIVTSDHGEHLGEEGRVDHQLSLDETLLRVPLVVRYPRYVRPARVREPVALTDVKPWIEELAAERVPAWSPPPDLAPPAYVAQYEKPVELIEFVRSRGRDAAPLDHRLAKVFHPEPDGGAALLLTSPSTETFSVVDEHGVERTVESLPKETFGLLRLALRQALDTAPFAESDDDLVPEHPHSTQEWDELRRLGYVAGGGATVGIHASEHWSAGLRAKAAGFPDVAKSELEKAARLAPDEPAIRQALAEAAAEGARAPPR